MKKIKTLRKKTLLVTITLIVIALISVPIISLAGSTYEIPNKAFKDANFYKCVIDSYNDVSSSDTNLTINDNISDENLALIKNLDCYASDVADTTGIEKLVNVEDVSLKYNELTNIDLSANIKIKELDLGNNNLKNVDLSALTELKHFFAENNEFKNINLEKNTNLITIYLNRNDLNTLDLSKNPLLEDLSLGYNEIDNIDLSNNPKLQTIYLAGNNLENLDVSKLTDLKELSVEHNYLSTINLANNSKLELLDASYNLFKTINLENVFNINNLDVSNNMLESIDLTDQNKLNMLDVRNNPIKNLTVNDVKLIKSESKYNQLEFKVNKLTLGPGLVIDLSNSPYELYLNEKVIVNKKVSVDTFLEEIGISGLTKEVYNGNTKVTTGNVEDGYTLRISYGGVVVQELPIEVFVNPYFKDKAFYKEVIKGYNEQFKTSLTVNDVLTKEQLAKIEGVHTYEDEDPEEIKMKIGNLAGIEYLTGLKNLWLQENLITNVDLSQNTKLESLDLSYNQLTSVNLTKNPNLLSLDLSDNFLEKIDLSKQTKLGYLGLDYNFIKEINVSLMKELGYLHLNENALKTIDVTKNTKLESLFLENNSIREIDLSKNVMLRTLYLTDNFVDNIDLAANHYLENFAFDGDMIVLGNDSKVNSVRFLKENSYSSNYAVRNGIKLEPKEIIKAKDYIRFANYSEFDDGMVIENYSEAIIYIKGDITGDGLLKINDISKLYQTLKGKVTLNDDEMFVADFNKDGEIKINDVSKAYQRLKGTINSL